MAKWFPIIVIFLSIYSCSTAETKGEPAKTNLASSYFSEEAIRAFLEKPAENGEVFRIYANSETYRVVQLSHKATIQLKPDEGGNKAVCEEIARYNMVEYFAEGMLKVELYPNNGAFYRVRQARPSGVKELDKLFSEDITRWQFLFPKNEINPREFKIRYGVTLVNKVSRDEARELLMKHAR